MSTSLLNDLLTDQLDHGYAEAARRRRDRAEAGKSERPDAARTAQVLLAVGLLLVGFVVAAAYRNTSRAAPQTERTRQALVRDVEQGTAAGDELRRRAQELSTKLVKERDAALTSSADGERLARAVRELERAAGLVPVHGPGLVVTMADASGRTDPTTGDRTDVPADDNGRLRDRDLQSVVNALWASGAEAIAINGERVAPNTAIRAAGEAILVDLTPTTSPYRIEAIGDPEKLLPRFAGSEAARRYVSYVGLYGISFTSRSESDLRLKAATGIDPRYAEPVPTGSPRATAGSPSPTAPTPGGPS